MTRAHITTSGVITKPLLAARSDGEDLTQLHYPLGVTTKIDGIRCLIIDGRAVSRTFKPIPNHHIRKILEQHLPNGMDIEIMSGNGFQECTGNIMREDGEPEFTVWIIDYVKNNLDEPYHKRIGNALVDLSEKKIPFQYYVLTPEIAHNWDDVLRMEAEALAHGHEGVMLRRLDAPYKCGRSTFREGILIKIKRFNDQEAIVTDVEELYHNENEAQKDAFGRTKRSTAQGRMVGANMLGSFIVKGVGGDYHDIIFRVGSGFNHEQRHQLWKDRKNLIGKLITVKYFPTGTKEAPRFPVWKGFRDPRDV